MFHHDHSVPRFPLLGAGALVLLSLVSVAWLRWFAEPDPASSSAPIPVVVAARSLRFEDQPGGVVRVLDGDSGVLIREFGAGEQGFIRATVRGLVRERRSRSIGPETAFRLEQRANGQLLLIDPTTGREIDLWAFGASNAQPFTEFFAPPAIAHETAESADTVAHHLTRSKTND